ncbi:Uncharacterised protein [Lysinibacillus sphaericus]|nr:Uncharacterised protein [Lysinibacillus sphaericus]
MTYLTHEEYSAMPFVDLPVEDFTKLVERAGDAVDSITSNFYQFTALESDFPIRRDKFKKAVACQIEYFHEMGATNSHGLNEPGSVTIGRTSMSTSTKANATNQEPQNSLISDDVYMYLQGTGLLYRGIGVM